MTQSDSSKTALVTARTPAEVIKSRLDALPAEERQGIESAIAQMVVAEQLSASIPKPVVWGAAFLARDLNLRFELGHVVVYPSKSRGRPTYTYYLTVDGWITWAGQFKDRHGDPLYAGLELETIVGEEKAALAIPDHLIARRARVYRLDFRVPTEGIGYADPTISDRVHPVEAKHPLMMAESRAIRRAMRRAFPLTDNPAHAAHIQASLPVMQEAEVVDVTPTALPNDDWRQFWIQAHERGFETAQVYEIIEEHSGQSLNLTDAKGVIGKSMRAFDGTPGDALAILEQHAASTTWAGEVDDPGGVGQGIAPTDGGQDPVAAELFGDESTKPATATDDRTTKIEQDIAGAPDVDRVNEILAELLKVRGQIGEAEYGRLYVVALQRVKEFNGGGK